MKSRIRRIEPPPETPDRVVPPPTAEGVEIERLSDGPLPDVREVERRRRGPAAAAAGVLDDVAGDERVAELLGLERDRRAATNRRPAALVLVDGEVDPLAVERPQRCLHPLAGHQLLEVSELATGQAKKQAVGTRVVLINGAPHERQEIVGAPCQASAHGLPRLRGAGPSPPEARHAPQQLRGERRLGQRQRLRHPADHARGPASTRSRAPRIRPGGPAAAIGAPPPLSPPHTRA